jgi:hypothetical protein
MIRRINSGPWAGGWRVDGGSPTSPICFPTKSAAVDYLLTQGNYMKVFVALNFTRDHETQVIGVVSTPDKGRSLLERHRKEPLSVYEDGTVNNFPSDGIPDMVGYVVPFVVDGDGGEDREIGIFNDEDDR